MTNYKDIYEYERGQFENYLTSTLCSLDNIPDTIISGIKYAVGSGGKRLRPMLAIFTAKLFGVQPEKVYPIALAVELIHNYSLVHDDLPCMDDDELRRGLPTVHVKYGEGMAVLIGDALLNLAIEILAKNAQDYLAKLPEIITAIFENSGAKGMIAGQCVDLESEGNPSLFSRERLEYLHLHKTACLIEAPIVASAIACGATASQIQKLKVYAKNVGLAFQITDDVLDVEGDEETFGKPIGSDALLDKLTYPRMYGLDESKVLAKKCISDACESLNGFSDTDCLIKLALTIENRIK